MAAETQYYDFYKIKSETGGDQEQRYYDFSGTFDSTVGTTSYKKPEAVPSAKSDPNEMARKTTDITRRNQARDSGLALPEIPAAQPAAHDVNAMARNTTDISLRNRQRDEQAAAYQEQRNARNAQTDEEREAAGQRAIAAEEAAYQLGKKVEANREAAGAPAASRWTASDYQAQYYQPDYSTESRYRSTRNGKAVSYTRLGQISETGYDDVLYDAINGDAEARQIQRSMDALAGGNSLYTTTHEGWYELPEQTKKLFNYIYAKQGREEAYAFLNDYADRGFTGPEAFGLGFMEGIGAASAAAAISGTAARLGADVDNGWYQEYQKSVLSAQATYPAVYAAGSTVGGLTLMAGASGATASLGSRAGEAVVKSLVNENTTRGAYNAAVLIGQTAAGAVHGAAMMAGISAVRNAGSAATGEMTGGEYASDIASAAGSGLAMSLTSAILSVGGARLIRAAGVDTAFSRYLKNLISGTAGMSVAALIEYAGNDDRQRASYVQAYSAVTGADEASANDAYDRAKRQQLGKQVLSGFIFSALSSVKSTAAEVAAGREKLEEVYDRLLRVYAQASGYKAATPEAQAAFLNDLKTVMNQYYDGVKNSEYAGQQKYVNKLLDELYSLATMEVGGDFIGLGGYESQSPAQDRNLLMLVASAVEGSEPQAVSEYRRFIPLGDNLKASGLTPDQTRGIITNARVPSLDNDETSAYFDSLTQRITQGEDLTQMSEAELGGLYALYAAATQRDIYEDEYREMVRRIVDSRELEAVKDRNATPDVPQLTSRTPATDAAPPAIRPQESSVQAAGTPENPTIRLAEAGTPENLTLPEIPEAPGLTESAENGMLTNDESQRIGESTAPSTLPTGDATQRKPHEALSDALLTRLKAGERITREDLQSLAADAYGGSRGSGNFDMKTAYDALELAVNRYLMTADFVKNGNGNAANARATEKRMLGVLDLLPTQNIRTEEQLQYQQFSTPPNIAYLAAWAANIDKADTVLEPSAGIGGLALWGKAWGAAVYGNELSQRRAEILRSLGLDEVFTENAEQINNILPDYVSPSVVLMNPPFSSTAGRTSANNTANAKRHVEQALERLQDGGRLVAILGRGMANGSKTFAPWWDELRKDYNIRANLSINGENYRKYGTDFDVQLVVIDKTGPQEDRSTTITGQIDDLLTVPEILEGIRNDRQRAEADNNQPVRRDLQPGTQPRPDSVVGRSGAGRGGERAEGGGLTPSARTGMERSGNGGRGNQPGGTRADELGAGDGGRGGIRREGGGDAGSDSGKRESERDDRPVPQLTLGGLSEAEEAPAKPKEDNGVYAEYVPPKTGIQGAKKHPAKLVESAAMASVPAPKVSYTPNLPKELITSGKLSDVQLTNIVYAGAAHSQMIPEQNTRKGYFIGDGTGVGKGRQIAGIILDNFRNGREKAVWISNGSNLYKDAQRDWSDIGGDSKQVYLQGKTKLNDGIKQKNGIVFTTYSTLSSKSKTTKKTRVDQLVEWLGEDFDGVIAFDEAHNMGNLLGKKGTFGSSGPAQKAIAGAELQKRLPNARIVYVSATMATDVDGMAFAERLGLWGPGTQFTNVRDFVDKIGSGGLAAMELVARDMKAMGVYQARSISYDGVQYETLTHNLTNTQTQIYDTMSRAWQITLRNMNDALKLTNTNLNSRAKSAAKSAYYGAMQRFYSQVITSMSMPSVISDIRKQLDAGKSVVLQIVNTNEAAAKRAITEMEDSDSTLEDLDITPRETLIGYLMNSYPVQEYEVYEDDNGKKQSRPVVDSAGNPVLNRRAVAERDRLIERIQSMSVPQGPLDLLFAAFGTENVAEVTGRKQRVVPGRDKSGNLTTIIEKRSDRSNDADVQAFQDGKKRILVFSDAGGTGKSYHADLRAKNQQQRVHYLLQPGWNAPKAVQGLGRTNRSNQANAPTYVLVTTNASGQKRFVSTIARRLDQLGAITKGQRQTGSGVFSAKDNLESDLARSSLVNFYRYLLAGQLPGLDAADIIDSLGLSDSIKGKDGKGDLNMSVASSMPTFLNRIMSLELDKQNAVFDAFNTIFEREYEKALEDGTLDMGMETVRADKVEVADEITVYTDPKTGAETKYVQAKAYTKTNPARTVEALKKRAKNFVGLYRKNDGTVIGVFSAADRTDESGAVTKRVKALGPVSSGTWQLKTLEKQAVPIPESEWDAAWAAEVEKAPKYKEEVKHMLTGALLPVWNKLPASGNVKVQRLIADDGRQYLGRIVEPASIDGVLKSLGATKGRTKKTYSPADVQKAVFQNGGKAILDNDRMTLTRRLVGGEQRIEISGDNLWAIRDRIPEIYTEIIQSKSRYFIPNGEKQLHTLEKLLKMNPVREVQEAKAASYARDVRTVNGNNLTPQPEAWTTERVGSREAKAMSLPDLVEKLRHEYGIPVNTGGLRAPDARAAYLTKPRSVRMKVTGAITDLSHELGHHLDNLYGISDNVTEEAMQEAISRLPDEFKAAYEEDELPGEALAEFLRRYFLSSATAKIDYPTFYDEFFGFFGKEEKAKLAEIADEFNAYYALSDEQENYPIHDADEKGTDFRTFSEKAEDVNEHFRMKFLDLTEPLRRIDKATGGKSHIFAINSGYANERARAALTGDLYDLHGNPIGEGLQKILKGINLNSAKERNALGMWLICKHGIEVLADGHRVFANDAWNNSAYMQSKMDDLEAKYPKIDFEDISERLYAFQKNVMEAYGVGGGLYSQRTVDKWNEKWKFYVPFYRWFDRSEKPGKGQRRGYVNQTGHVRRLVGSGRDFINPIDNIMESTVRLITTAIYNDVARHAFDDISAVEGLGYLAEKWPEPVKKTTMNVTEEKGAFLSDLEARGLVDQDTYDEIANILNNEIGDVLEQYSRGKVGGDTVTVMRSGKPETWKINDPNLLRALTNLTPNRRESILNAIGSVTRFITGNITGRNVVWAITSNSVRDLETASIIGGPRIIPKLISGIVENWANSFRGDSANPLFKEYMAMGGESASAYTADRQMQKKIRNELQHTRWHYLNPITYMSFISDTVERGPRYAYYKICRTEYGMTPEEAFYAAGEITTNFHRRGLYGSELNALIPFSGASLQGMDRAARWIRAEEVTYPGKRKKTARGRILAYLGASFAIAVLETLLNNSNDRKRKYYRYLSGFTKNSYFVVPLKGGKVLALPKARELMIPISFFERLIERTVLDNRDAFDGFWEYVTDNTLPGVISGIAQGDWNSVVGDLAIIGDIHYLVSNQDFLGRPIVSASLENLNPEDQYNNSTSVPAKIIGETFKVSPQMVDYIGSNYFTFAWKPTRALWNVGGNTDYTLGVRSQWEKDPLFSTDFVNSLYDARDRAEQNKNSSPTDPDKAMKWKLLDSMTTAYSRYYALARTQPEDAQSRALRESVLDAVEGALNGNSTDPAFRYVRDAVAKADSPGDVMPSAVLQTLKYGDDKSISLTASEYWNYQTDYNAKFYNYVRQAMKASHTPDEKVNVCKAAKDVASIMAKGAVIEAHGGTYDSYDELLDFIEGGGEVSEFIQYKAAKNAVDDDGYNSAEAIGVVAGLQLPTVYSQAFMLSQQSESLGRRFKEASGYGVDINEYALVMDGWEDTQDAWRAAGKSGESGWTQKAAEEAIDAVYGRTTVQNRSEKAAAWQALNAQWSPKNNPYSEDVGRSIYGALQLPTK